MLEILLRGLLPSSSLFIPDNPFLTCFSIHPNRDLILEELWLLWCMITLYSMSIEFPLLALYQCTLNNTNRTLLFQFLEWFKPISAWQYSLKRLIEVHGIEERPIKTQPTIKTLFILHRPFFRWSDGLLCSQNSEYEGRTYDGSILEKDTMGPLRR